MRLATVLLLLGALLGVTPASAAYAAPSESSVSYVALGRGGHSSSHSGSSSSDSGFSSSSNVSKGKPGSSSGTSGSFGRSRSKSYSKGGKWVLFLVLGVFLLVGIIFAVVFFLIKAQGRRQQSD